MADHHDEHHEELPHQAPWVMWMTLASVAMFFGFFLAVKYSVS